MRPRCRPVAGIAPPRGQTSARAEGSWMFRDREDAGCRLAQALARFKQERPVVLALPRGGVPVGLEIAKALDAPLDLVLVRKIGAPDHPELAVAAVVDGDDPQTVVNRSEEHTSELQSLMRSSYAVFCLKKK